MTQINPLTVTILQDPSRWLLPFRARHYGGETVSSYFDRLKHANHSGFLRLSHRASLAALAFPECADRARERAVELHGGLPEGSFDARRIDGTDLCSERRCECAGPIAENRYLCVQCAKGEPVALAPTLKPFVCVRHQRWVGPGVGPDEQLSVRGVRSFTRAGNRHRRMLGAGVLDPLRFRAIWKILTDAYQSGAFVPPETRIAADWRFRRNVHASAVTYPSALELYSCLETAPVLERLLHPENGRRVVEEMLSTIVEETTGAVCDTALARELRYHLRPDFYRVALASKPCWHDGASTVYPPAQVHLHDRDLSRLDYSTWPARRKGVAPGFPGFDHPESPLYIVPGDGKEFRHEFWNDPRGKLFDEVGRITRNKSFWICRAGHVLEVSAVGRERAPRTGCGACAKKITVPGVTDIATTDPEAFRYWDHCANLVRGLRYWEVSGAREEMASWVCEKGHSFKMYIMLFAEDPRCRRCHVPGQRVVDVARECPQALPLWDAERNAAFDMHRVVANVDILWWRCPAKGHLFDSTLKELFNRRHICPICSGKRIVPGVNDFQTLYPEKAEEFSWALNGGVTPDTLSPGSQRRKYFWVCRKGGHVYPMTVNERVLGFQCTQCTGRRLTAGETDFGTARPAAAARWHSVANGILTPRDVHRHSNRKAYFTCLCDRPYLCVIRFMRGDRYCRKCTDKLHAWRLRKRSSARQ